MKTKLKDGQKLAPQFRTARIILNGEEAGEVRAQLDDDNRIVKNVSVCSDEPYKRYYGMEILTHSAEAIDLARIKKGASPLLFNHDRDALLGKVSNPVIKDGKLYVDFKFSKSEMGQQMLSDLKDGILTECSIGYEVTKFEVDEDEETYTATRWTIYEVSLVTIPADASVGVGRDVPAEGTPVEIIKKGIDTTRENEKTDSQDSEHSQERENTMEKPETPAAAPVNEKQVADNATAVERKRVSDIQDLSRHFAEKGIAGRKIDTSAAASSHIKEGKTLAEFQSFVMAGEFKEVAPVATPEGDQRLDENGSESRIQVVGERQARQIIKSIGRSFVESAEFKKEGTKRGGRRQFSVDIPDVSSFRATAATSTITNFNGIVQLPNIVEIGVQQATVADLLSQGTTNLAAVPYLQEDTLTVAATTVAEGAAKPEVTWDWSQTSAPVKKIAVISKVTDELFADVPTIQSYVNMRLRYMVEIVEDAQLLTGDGTGANITGILATSGIQTQAKGADTVLDAVRKAMTKVQSTGFFPPTGAVFHPNDWEAISLAKDANGQYLAGGPFYAPYGNGEFVMFYRIWGLSVVVTTSMTENTGLVGNFKLGASIFRRQGITIDSTNSNEDDFKNNLIALRAEERLALAVWRPKAFCQVTGI